MHMEFTEKEERYLVKEPFNWHVKDGAPADVRDSINKKLNDINSQGFRPSRGNHG